VAVQPSKMRMTDSEIIQGFRNLYGGGLANKRREAGSALTLAPWQEVSWLGKFVSKCPMDLWVYQEVIWETKPDVILECGSSGYGSAFFFATMFDLIGNGHVYTVDVDVYDHLRREHPRITYLVGDSVSDEILSTMAAAAQGKKTMVSMDSDHRYVHVKKELEAYSKFVTPGQYIVVEDIGIYDAASAETPPDFLPAPLASLEIGDTHWGTKAVSEFCKANRNFVQDMSREKHLICGYAWLKRES
jgi:cephalosporin hydroxylase